MAKSSKRITTFGERIGDLISNNHTTAKQLSVVLDVEEGTISKWRNSKDGVTRTEENKSSYIPPKIRSDVLIALADYFHVSTDYLLGLSDNPAAETGAESVAAYIHWFEDSVNKLHSNPIPARYIEGFVQNTHLFDFI